MKKNIKKDDKKNNNNNSAECGEFVPSFFTWQSLDKQKKRANELDDMTKKNK